MSESECVSLRRLFELRQAVQKLDGESANEVNDLFDKRSSRHYFILYNYFLKVGIKVEVAELENHILLQCGRSISSFYIPS